MSLRVAKRFKKEELLCLVFSAPEIIGPITTEIVDLSETGVSFIIPVKETQISLGESFAARFFLNNGYYIEVPAKVIRKQGEIYAAQFDYSDDSNSLRKCISTFLKFINLAEGHIRKD